MKFNYKKNEKRILLIFYLPLLEWKLCKGSGFFGFFFKLSTFIYYESTHISYCGLSLTLDAGDTEIKQATLKEVLVMKPHLHQGTLIFPRLGGKRNPQTTQTRKFSSQ